MKRETLSLALVLSAFTLLGCASVKETYNEMRNPAKPIVDLNLNRDWRCAKEGTDNICKPVNAQAELEKVIIWSAKEKGAEDSIPSYQSHLAE